MTGRIPVYLEVRRRRTFAGAVEWLGWCRAGKTEAEAVAALVAYADRYARVIARSRLGFERPEGVDDLEVVERLEGNATTELGAPGVPPNADDRPLNAKELKRLTTILEASWRAFDRVAEAAVGVTLTKGPRGGGRDLPKMVDHVMGAEESYLVALGSRRPADTGAQRKTILATLAARAQDKPLADPNKVKKTWSPRFLVRRAAWHVLDHAWELEDRS
ncbi:MAG: hypothetical protein H0W81_08095 [Chloroflexi bacterium]|nr:hypothetical protein [Chloroflexota bacterium]